MNVKLNLALAAVLAVVMALAVPARALSSGPPSPVSLGASASDSGNNGNPYSIITDRNVFRLNTPPLPQKVEEKPVELPKVTFSGTMKIGNVVRALFSIPPKDAKSQTAYLTLSPGDKQDVLELVSINPNQREVEVLVSGTRETLVASNNASGALPAPAPLAAVPQNPNPTGAPTAIVAGGEHGPGRYGAVQVAGGGGGGGGVVSIGGGSGLNPSALINPASENGGGGGVSVAGGAQFANTLASATGNQGASPNHIATPEEQVANMIVQHALTGGNGPPLPPSVAATYGDLTGSGPPGPPPPPSSR